MAFQELIGDSTNTLFPLRCDAYLKYWRVVRLDAFAQLKRPLAIPCLA